MSIENKMVIGVDEELITREKEQEVNDNKIKKFNVEGHSTFNFSIEVQAKNEEEAMDYVMENYTAPEIVDVGNMFLQVEYAELINE